MLDLLLGPVRAYLPLPLAPPTLIGRLALVLSRRLDRENRTQATLFARGLVVVVLLCGLAVGLGTGLQILSHAIPYGFVLRGLVLWGCVRVSRPLGRLREGARRFKTDIDAVGPGRIVLEQTAVSFVYFVVAPLFWFLVAGLPGLLLAVTGWGLERAALARDGRPGAFGFVAYRFARALAWVPARIAELILVLASLVVPRGQPAIALWQAWSHASWSDIGPVAALAGGLGVTLAGPSVEAPGRSWVGTGRAKVGRSDIHRAIWLYAAAQLIVAGLLAALSLNWPLFAQL